LAELEEPGGGKALNEARSSGVAAEIGAVDIRHCHDISEFQACVDLQREVWKFSDADLVPVRMFVVASKIGGQVIGAFAGDVLVGFALSIPGAREGHSYLHSHMLAVREQYRNAGLGRKLKLAQREDAIANGFQQMEWTFDPLEIKNAYLNIERLGAIVRRYSVNQYGTSSSPLQGGLPTDRCVAEWWLKSNRVRELLEQGRRSLLNSEKKISVPAEIYKWKSDAAQRGRALNVLMATREQFQEAFSSGLAVLGYDRDEAGNGSFLLGHARERFEFTEVSEGEASPATTCT
jgi:predicted GNAT superfamily acetyltransferase